MITKKQIEEGEMKEVDDTLYIRLPEKYYTEDWKLYKKGIFELKEGITILVGCNGYGKSTTMQAFKDIIKENKYKIVSFDNYRNGGNKSVGDALFVNDISLAATILTGSEGEGIITNISRMAVKIGNYVRHCDQDRLFVFLDAIDGLSIDIINELKKDLLKRAIKDAKNLNKKTYIFVSANDYEFASGEQCLDVYSGKYITFNDYKEYKRFILKTSRIKTKRYEEEED